MPDVVKHAWTHRPRSQGGTDPIEVGESAPTPVGIMTLGDRSIATGTKLYIPMDLFWTNDPATFGYADVTSASAKFMTIGTPGVYRAVGIIGWDNSAAGFTAGDEPLFAFSTEFGGVDGDLVPGLNEYLTTDTRGFEGPWNSQMETDSVTNHSVMGEVIFNFSEDNWGETPMRVGLSIYSNNSRTLTFFAQLAIYRLSTELVDFVAIS